MKQTDSVLAMRWSEARRSVYSLQSSPVADSADQQESPGTNRRKMDFIEVLWQWWTPGTPVRVLIEVRLKASLYAKVEGVGFSFNACLRNNIRKVKRSRRRRKTETREEEEELTIRRRTTTTRTTTRRAREEGGRQKRKATTIAYILNNKRIRRILFSNQRQLLLVVG